MFKLFFRKSLYKKVLRRILLLQRERYLFIYLFYNTSTNEKNVKANDVLIQTTEDVKERRQPLLVTNAIND